MYCGRSGPENLWLSVYVSVCEQPFGKITGPISTKLTHIGSLKV